MADGVVETPTARLWLEDGILFYEVKEGVYETEEIARADLQASLKLTQGQPYRVLVDISRIRGMSREARLFHGSEETARHTIAAALVVASPLSRIVGNFIMRVTRVPHTIRLFSDCESALAWLRTLPRPD